MEQEESAIDWLAFATTLSLLQIRNSSFHSCTTSPLCYGQQLLPAQEVRRPILSGVQVSQQPPNHYLSGVGSEGEAEHCGEKSVTLRLDITLQPVLDLVRNDFEPGKPNL